MKQRFDVLPPYLAAELEGVEDWHVEMGGKHVKLFLGGRLVGVFSNGCRGRKRDRGRDRYNVRAQIRRRLKEMQEETNHA